jgi:hypothetical protein
MLRGLELSMMTLRGLCARARFVHWLMSFSERVPFPWFTQSTTAPTLAGASILEDLYHEEPVTR